MTIPTSTGKRGNIVLDTLLLMMFLGLHKLGNICCGHEMFLNKIRNSFCVPDTPGHKFCVRNKCCARGQTGKHLCRQQCVLVCHYLNELRIVRRQQRGELLTFSLQNSSNMEKFPKEMSHFILHERVATWETNQLRLFWVIWLWCFQHQRRPWRRSDPYWQQKNNSTYYMSCIFGICCKKISLDVVPLFYIFSSFNSFRLYTP